MAPPLLSQRLKELEKLTPSEVKIADYFLRHLDLLALENVTTLSEKIKVSKATMVRFIARLGYTGFAQLHEELKGHARSRHQFLSARYTLKLKQQESGDLLGENIAAIIRNLHHTFETLDPRLAERVARMIVETPGTLYITGQRSSQALAMLFRLMIQRIRPEAALIDARIQTEPEAIQNVDSGDLLVAIFRQPYANLTHTVARYFKTRGAGLILVTDSRRSPLAEMADVQLVVTSQGLTIFNSFTAVTALLESIHHLALRFCDSSMCERLDATEALFDQFDVFCLPAQRKPNT